MAPIANINSLIGRSYVSKSGNTCKIIKLADGAIRATWKYRTTEKDIIEFENWVKSLIGPLNVTTYIDLENEEEALRKWQESKL